MTIITGVFYPLFIWVVSQVLWSAKANGSLLEKDGKVIGAELIAQNFSGETYFWTRPSAVDYNPLPSGGSNWAQFNEKNVQAHKQRMADWRTKNAVPKSEVIPPDILAASGSGLDPHISPIAALQQFERVSKARNWDKPQQEKLRILVENYIENYQWGFLGNPRVNVLNLNLALDQLK